LVSKSQTEGKLPRGPQFRVIQFVPDLIRREVVNVGLVVTDSQGAIIIDFPKAARSRALNLNRSISERALDYKCEQLREHLSQDLNCLERPGSSANGWLKAEFSLTDPGFYDIEMSLESAVQELCKRLIEVPHRGYPAKNSPSDEIQGLLKTSNFAHLVVKDQKVQGSRTGAERVIEFYRNSSVNTAVDGIRLDLSRHSEIVQRIDAVAFKIEDILAFDPSLRYGVYGRLGEDSNSAAILDQARNAIASAGGQFVSDADQAVELLSNR
jgi:Protein of unknown function (DUF3037)